MKKITDIITTVLLTVVILLAVLLAGVRLVGLAPYTVLSGSMEPRIHVGSVVYVKKVNPHDLEVGHAITYVIEGGTVVTHEIVEILHDPDVPARLAFRTKGLANETADGTPVLAENVIGKAVFSIPLLGYVAHFIQNPPGSYLTVAVLAALILMAFLPDFLCKLFGAEETPAEEMLAEQGLPTENEPPSEADPPKDQAPAPTDGAPPPVDSDSESE